MRLRRSRLLVLAVLALGAAPRTVARADYEETERRLKAAGVDDALRGRVHAAIDKGVDFLVKRQRKDGSFVDHWRPPADSPMADVKLPGDANVDGITVLCALALRHASTPATDAGVKKAMAYLFDKPLNAKSVEDSVYEGGIALMLLASTPGREAQAKRIAGALAGALDEKTAWWGYNTPGGGEDPTKPRTGFHASIPNLSTAQFGALGLWAARRLSIDVATSVWARHAASMCDRQRSTGSWDYSDDAVKTSGGPPPGVSLPVMVKTTNTYMGFANLVLCRQALVAGKSADAKLLARIDKALASARRTLARDAQETLADPRSDDMLMDGKSIGGLDRGSVPFPPGVKLPPVGKLGKGRRHALSPGIGAYYTLYALEKACLFADIESFDVSGAAEPPADPGGKPGKKPSKPAKAPPKGRLAWYATGAKWLVGVQRQDGGWSPDAGDPPGDDPSEIDTALALLFLLRSPSVFHPTTPTPVDARPRAVTQTDSAPSSDGRGASDPASDPEKPAPPPTDPEKPEAPDDGEPAMGADGGK